MRFTSFINHHAILAPDERKKRAKEDFLENMAKLKGLLPSLREKKRYIAFEVMSETTLHFNDVTRTLWNSLLHLFGEVGAADAGLLFVKDQYKNNKGILRVKHTAVNRMKAAMAFTTTVNTAPVIVRSLGTSGILNKAIKRGEI